ncbi:MAG TPA: DEAD/DEAH box helicase, partial [Polyangiaceae bacterium]|nr:DEAD/DEAH box helicase [Polyangiaceae bacterium]
MDPRAGRPLGAKKNVHPSNPTPSEATTASREDSSSDSAGAPGKPADKPAPTFDLLPLSAETRRALADVGYTSPTPVQLAVWEPATRGKDAVVQARTGTGKTASFALPIVDHVVRRSEKAAQVLVLTPTRELALQVAGEVERLGKYRETRVTAIYGGASMEKQIDAIKDGAQVICGTPGRVLDHIKRGTLSTASIRLLVLDEADEMLSMGFERELTAILESLPKARQTLLFSATVPPDIERISKSRLKDPEFLTLSGDHIGALEIQHFVYMVTGDKVGTLVRILESENPESAIIFCNTRDETSAVALALQQRGYDADWLNGDLPQSEREKVMTATRAGKLRFLVATDVAARGIDVSHVTHVINYDFPQDAEAYVHRTGRTGRAGRTGTAIALVTPQDIGGLYLLRLTYKIRPIERRIPSSLELKTRAETDMITALAESFLQKGTHPDDRALARRLITHDQAEGILAGLLREYLGPRPTAQEDASQARRATPRRASLRRRGEDPATDREAGPASGEVADHARAADTGEASPERHERGASDRGPRERAGREPRRDREARHERAPRDRHDRAPRHEGADRPVRADGADRPGRLEEIAGAVAPAAAPIAAPTAVAAIAEPSGERLRGRREEGRREEPREGGAPRRERRGTPVAELANWQPPVDASDDEP